MKFLKSHKVIHSDRLFHGKYKYKAVISCGVAGLFRGGDLGKVLKYLDSEEYYYTRSANSSEKAFGRKLVTFLSNIEAWHIRVETPYISLYLNTIKDLESAVKFGTSRVKYISLPDPASESKLSNQTVLVKKLDFAYKVTLGATQQNYISFVSWCKDNAKIRLPKRAANDLNKNYSPGGGFFYVKDDKSLIMVKMFLGRTITKVENVVRA
jgi:hypothetical protein